MYKRNIAVFKKFTTILYVGRIQNVCIGELQRGENLYGYYSTLCIIIYTILLCSDVMRITEYEWKIDKETHENGL